MKIIALIPFKNEEWILPTFLLSVKQIADEIIALDDNSTDNSVEILEKNGVIVKKVPHGEFIPMSYKRQVLLDEGRKRHGTHFIWLDADEAFSANFIKNAKNIIKELKPGQKLSMQWVALWKSPYNYRNDNSVWSNNYKDFIVCDDLTSNFKEQFLSEARTQGVNNEQTLVKIKPEEGVVLHFQFINWDEFQLKQAWYRCSELINSPENALGINNTYSITLDDPTAETVSVPKEWLEGINIPENISHDKSSWHLEAILNFFDKYGIEFFEPLQIWHIQELYDEFLKRVKRKPKIIKKKPYLTRVFNKIKRVTFSKLKGV